MAASALINYRPLAAETAGDGTRTGRLSHPVLFIPGFGGAPEHFGIDVMSEWTCQNPVLGTIKPTLKRVQNPPTMAGWQFSEYTLWNDGHVDLILELEGQCAAGVPFRVTRTIPLASWHEQQAARKWMNYATGGTINATLAQVQVHFAPTSDNRITIDHTIDVAPLVDALKGQPLSAVSPATHADLANVYKSADWIESYREGSAPARLAATFGLTLQQDDGGLAGIDPLNPPTGTHVPLKGTGINGNGIYVFQSKTLITPDSKCTSPDAADLDVEAGWVWRQAACAAHGSPAVAVGGVIDGGVPTPAPNPERYCYNKVNVARVTIKPRCNGVQVPGFTLPLLVDLQSNGQTSMGYAAFLTEPKPENQFQPNLSTKLYWTHDPTGQEVRITTLAPGATPPIRIGGSIPYQGPLEATYNYAQALRDAELPFVPRYLPDDNVKVDWTGLGLDGGKSDQLYERMKEVLDDFYGVGVWHGKPDAQIDLVGHSQGGLAIREMIANAMNDVPDNPVSHIRQILTLVSPLHGTALATDNEVLKKAQIELDQNLGQKPYPELALLRDGLIDGKLDCQNPFFPQEGCFNLNAGIKVKAKVGVTFSVAPELQLRGPWLGPYQLYVLGIVDVGDPIDLELRSSLKDFAAKGADLGWPQSSAAIAGLVYDPNKRKYPVYPGSFTAIPITTLASPSAGNFAQDAVAGVVEAFKVACPLGSKMWQRETTKEFDPWIGPDFKVTFDREWINCSDFHESMDRLGAQVSAQLVPLDQGWSQQGDLFVDFPSQKGIRGDLPTWDPGFNPEFRNDLFRYNQNVIHGPFKVDQPVKIDAEGVRLRPLELHAIFPGASMQGCDILDQLGVTQYDQSTCVEVDHTGFRTANPANAVVEVMGGVIEKAHQELVLRLRNILTTHIGSLVLEVPLEGDRNARPIVSVQGVAARVQTVTVGDGSWIARVALDSLSLAPGQSGPTAGGFTVRWTEPSGLMVRSLVGSPTEGWKPTTMVAARTSTGVLLSGQSLEALRGVPADAKVEDILEQGDVLGHQSRGTDGAWTKPVLRISNSSTNTLEHFDLVYHVQARADGARPVLEMWNFPWNAQPAQAELVAGENEWLVVIHFRGHPLEPGQEWTDLKFGLHWPDWSPWDVARDPSEPGSATDVIVHAQVFEVSEATIPSPPSDPSPVLGNWIAEGIDEGRAEPNILKPRLRFRNEGPVGAHGLEIRIPFHLPEGLDPVLDLYYPSGCTGQIDGTTAERTVFLRCPEVVIPAGTWWPDAQGAVFGIHDKNWRSWPRGGDDLTRTLGGSWTLMPMVEAR